MLFDDQEDPEEWKDDKTSNKTKTEQLWEESRKREILQPNKEQLQNHTVPIDLQQEAFPADLVKISENKTETKKALPARAAAPSIPPRPSPDKLSQNLKPKPTSSLKIDLKQYIQEELDHSSEANNKKSLFDD